MVTIQREHEHYCNAHRITYYNPYPIPPGAVDAGSVCDRAGEWGSVGMRP